MHELWRETVKFKSWLWHSTVVFLEVSSNSLSLRFMSCKMRLIISVYLTALFENEYLIMGKSFSKLWEIVKNREAWRAAVRVVTKSWT